MPASRFITATLGLAASFACPIDGWAEPPTVQQQDLIEDHFIPNFVLPQTSIWRFSDVRPYIDGQTLICGKVNFQSAMRRYVGFQRFFAAIDHDQIILAQLENPDEDPSGKLAAKLDLLCGKG